MSDIRVSTGNHTPGKPDSCTIHPLSEKGEEHYDQVEGEVGQRERPRERSEHGAVADESRDPRGRDPHCEGGAGESRRTRSSRHGVV